MLCSLEELCAPLLQGFLCIRRRLDSSAVVLMLCLLDELCVPLVQGFLCKKKARI